MITRRAGDPIKFDGASGPVEERTVEETTENTEEAETTEAAEAADDKSGGLGVLLLAVVGAVVFLLNRNRA